MNILLKGWGAYTRMAVRWPGLAAIVPFIPVVLICEALEPASSSCAEVT